MPPVDEPMSFEPGQSRAGARKPKTPSSANEPRGAAPPPPGAGLVALTVDASAGRIVKVEGVDAAGVRHDLTNDERARLGQIEVGATLQGIVEEAFEAGIACALGERTDESDASESEEDAELSRTLLRSLIKRSAAKRFLQREVLGRAIVDTLVRQVADPGVAPSENAAVH
jgi:hypothetical protein